MKKVLLLPLNQNHVLIFKEIIKVLNCDYEVLCHDRISEGEQYHTEPLLKKFGIKYRHFYHKIDVKPTNGITKRILQFTNIKRQVDRLYNEIQPDLTVVALDNDPISQIVINESRKRGMKAILVSEGLIKPFDLVKRKPYKSDYFYMVLRAFGICIKYIQYSTGKCDYILVSGQRSFDVLKKLGIDIKKLIIVGQQKYDDFLKKIRLNEYKENDPKRLLYAASTRIMNNPGEINLIKVLCDSGSKLGVDVIVKLHPRMPNKTNELYNLAGLTETPHFKIIKEGYDTYDLLKETDVVITISSAIVLEALMMDKEFITASYLAGNRRFDYKKYDAIYSIEKEAETHNILHTASINKKPYSNKKQLLEDEIYRLDGKASQRTADVIADILNT